ncbi:MAG TPA: GNAT family N-acetyltransferase [Longimicrobium sp.]|nr:GNAT family N-acetyltransferase [Longimicrobium sp.]
MSAAAPSGAPVVRAARPQDAEAVSTLITSLSRYFLADPDDPGAAAAFLLTLAPAPIRELLENGRFRYHVAEVDGVLAGVVGMRDARHLHHLFVAEPFHGRGIGGRLWDTARRQALAEGNPGEFTVNSSRHAIPLYERLGFRATDSLRVTDGIAYLPMRLAPAA